MCVHLHVHNVCLYRCIDNLKIKSCWCALTFRLLLPFLPFSSRASLLTRLLLSCKNNNLILILIFNTAFQLVSARMTIIITNLQPSSSSLGAFRHLLLVPIISFELSYIAFFLLLCLYSLHHQLLYYHWLLVCLSLWLKNYQKTAGSKLYILVYMYMHIITCMGFIMKYACTL